MSSRIGVITILYKTTKINLPQSDEHKDIIYIFVDNTPNQDLHIKSSSNCLYLPLRDNTGIANAQNKGLEIAREKDCSHIVFLDQDSELPNEYVSKIVKEYERLIQLIPNLFLLGPKIYNGRKKEEYKSVVHKDHITNIGFIPRREIISSGSCTSIKRIDEVGILDSKLFIDTVDFEWCWRANIKGFQSGITNRVSITHYVGQKEYKIFNQLIIISSPIRYFYQIRNYIWLLRRKYVPFSWKINTGIKKIIYPLTYPFMTKEWGKIYKYIFKGFLAGLKQKNND